MKRWLLLFVLLSFASPLFAQSHPDVVAAVKAELVAKGITLSGECGAFAITKRVAWQLRGEGAGLLDKPGGSNCQGFATDIIAYPGGRIFDILIDGGGSNGPAWNASDPVDASRYRPAVDPGDAPSPTPTPTPAPVPVPTLDLSGVYQRIDWSDANNERRYQDLKAEAAASAARDAALAVQVKAHDDKPSLVEEILKSPYLYTIVGSILAGRYALPAK